MPIEKPIKKKKELHGIAQTLNPIEGIKLKEEWFAKKILENKKKKKI